MMLTYIAVFLIILVTLILAFGLPAVLKKADDGAGVFEGALNNRFVFFDLKKYFIIYFVLLIVILLVLLAIGFKPLVTIVVMVVLILGPIVAYKIFLKRRMTSFEKQLPDGLQMIAGALRAGSSLSAALLQLSTEFPAPLSQEISLVVREQKLGLNIDLCLQNLAERMPLNSVILTVSTIRIANETGGELAESLARTANTLRLIEQAEGKIAALTSQGKMQAWVVGLMPVSLIVVLDKMEPEAMGQLWTTKEGWLALAMIVTLEFLGIYVIRKIVNIDV